MLGLKNYTNSKIEEIIDQNDYEVKFFKELSRQENIVIQIRQIDLCECLMCGFKNDDFKKYETLANDLYDSMCSLFKHELLFIKFKNQQITNDLILRSFKLLIQSHEKLNLRNKSFSLLNYLLNETCKDSLFYVQTENTEWYNQLVQEFFFSIQKQINKLISDNSCSNFDYNIQNEIVELINNVFKFSKFNDLSFQLISSFMNFLKSKVKDTNISKFISISFTILNKICKEILIGEASSVMLRIKFYAILGFFKDFLIFLQKNYEHELILSKEDIIGEFLDCLRLMKTYHCTDIGGVCYEIYDSFLNFLNKKIDQIYNLNIETVKFCVNVVNRFVDYTFKKSEILSQRHECLLEIMIKILIDSNFDLNKETNFKIVKMAYDSIYSIMTHKNNRVSFVSFHEKYWKLMKLSWHKTIAHEKGVIGLQIIECFLNNFDSIEPSQIETMSYFFDSFQEYFHLKKNSNPEQVLDGTECILINLMHRYKKIKNSPILKKKFNEIILLFFEFGKRLDFIQWNLNFSTFNFELMTNNFEAIFKQENLLDIYFDLTIGKLNLLELKKVEELKPNVKWEYIISGSSYFISKFVKKLKNKLDNDYRYEIISFLDYMMNRYESIDGRLLCQKSIKFLLDLPL